MKTSLFLSVFFAFMSGIFSQGINYQALARYTDGSTITSLPITVEISIFSESGSATSIYKENHNLSTDPYGLFNLVIGTGTPAEGSFELIDWKKVPLYLGVRLNTGSGFNDMGRHPLQGTPFSFYSKEAGKSIDMMLSDLTDVQTTALASGQVLKWNGSFWAPAADDGQTYSAGTGININGNVITNSGDLSNTNELQNLNVNGNQLSISNGNTVTLPTGDGGDNWGSQTVASGATLAGLGTLSSPLRLAQQSAANGQVLKWNGTTWTPAADNSESFNAGTGISIINNTIANTGDLSNTNELQNLSINGNQLSISSGNTITLPSATGGDNWGTQIVESDATLSGLGTQANPLKIAQQSAVNGQVLKWNGSNWIPAADNGQTYIAGTGINIIGNTIVNTGDTNPNDDITTSTQAGGDISGPFSNLQINANTIGTNEIANGSITAADLATGVIPTTLPPNGSSGGDLSGSYPNPLVDGLQGRPLLNTAPVNGQVLQWNGTAWGPASPTGGSSVWSTNNSNAFYNTGNVGVGTNTPHNKIQLHNSDIFAGSPSALQLTNNNTGNAANNGLLLTLNSTLADYGLMGGLMMRENAPLGLGTNNNYHLFLKQSGLLGLGTFNPQGKMEIEYNSTSHTNPNLLLTHSSNNYSRISFRSDIAPNKYWTLASRTQDSDAASQFNLFYHNGTTGMNILSINGSGNVGIGNITPSEKFQVDGNARVVKLGINTAPTATEHLNVNGDARISNLGINTSPTERLDVNGNIRVTGEVNRPSTGAANLVPVCYGNVSLTGTINTGSSNFTVVRTSAGVYEITITGENYFFSNYVTQATLIGVAGLISTSSVNGKLLVRTYALGVGAVANDQDFCFTVFKP